MKPADWLNSINTTKVNLIRDSGAAEAAEKLYTPFLTLRSLSYYPDCIMYVNELNIRGLADFNITKGMHYEFLLHAIEKKKRFSPWQKPEKNEDIQLIMDKYRYSYDKARDVLDLFSESDLVELRKAADPGGTAGKQKR